MRADVARFTAACPHCQAVKVGVNMAPPLSNKPVASPRFADVMVDVVGPMPDSFGMKYLLTILDRTSRFVEAVPMPVATAESCADAFIAQWVSRYGLPLSVVTDNSNSFVAHLWKGLHDALGIIVGFTPVYSPASLGGLERKHRDIKVGLKTTLRQMGDQHGSQWLRALPWVMLGRRTAF